MGLYPVLLVHCMLSGGMNSEDFFLEQVPLKSLECPNIYLEVEKR